MAKIGIWAAKHQILASLLGIHSPQWAIANIASTAGATAAGFWVMAGVGAVGTFLTQNPAPASPSLPAPPPRIPIADPSEGSPDGARPVYWLEIYLAAYQGIKEMLGLQSAKRMKANKVDPNCLKAEIHHAIPWNSSYNHQSHRLIREAGVNLETDPRNLRPVLGHRGRHTDAYNMEVRRRLEAAYNSMSAFSTKQQLDAAVGKVMVGIWRDIDNGTLRPYDSKEVYLQGPCK